MYPKFTLIQPLLPIARVFSKRVLPHVHNPDSPVLRGWENFAERGPLKFLWGAALFFCLVASLAKAAQPSATLPPPQLSQEVLHEISQSKEWHLALFYARGWWGERSLVDDQDFFLHSNGKRDAEAELTLFVKGIYSETASVAEENSLHCRFPQRAAVVREALAHKGIRFPTRECPEQEKFYTAVEPEGMALVFSSYYPNSPSSLFGHTFLRFPRRAQPNSPASPLLDLSVSYTAHPTTGNPLLYPLYGLAGFFPGRFDFLPYYMKVQEYSNSEARDLWEYRLAVSEAGTRAVLRALWEIRERHIDYYYLDDNCAFMLLHLVEIARPDLDLRGQFPTFVVPGDTLFAVAQVPGLVQDVVFRPSVFRRFLNYHEHLSYSESEILRTLVSGEAEAPALRTLPPRNQARILDTLLEYIDFDERLAGSKEAVKWKKLRHTALAQRAQLGENLTPADNTALRQEIPVPEQERPERAHPASRIAAWGGLEKQMPSVQISWRPALHDLASRRTGYSRQLEIGFSELEVRWQKTNHPLWVPQVRKYSLLHILGANAAPPLASRRAWGLDMEWSHENPSDTPRTLFRLGLGTGKEFSFVNAFVLGAGEAHFDTRLGPRVGAGAVAGTIFEISENTHLRFDLRGFYFAGRKSYSGPEARLGAIVSHALNERHEFRWEGELFSAGRWDTRGGWLYYF